MKPGRQHYVFIDEIQEIERFDKILNGFLPDPDLGFCVIGSRADGLSANMIAQFRGRARVIEVHPLSFMEIMGESGGQSRGELWRDYLAYGGLPKAVRAESDEARRKTLPDLLHEGMLSRIAGKNHLPKPDLLFEIGRIPAGGLGSETSPAKITDALESRSIPASRNTVGRYLDLLEDSFLTKRLRRFDVERNAPLKAPFKFYFADVGLGNAFLAFASEPDPSDVIENIVFNELAARECEVSLGTIEKIEKEAGKSVCRRYEADFVARKFDRRAYMQVTTGIDGDETLQRELRPFGKIRDSYPKYLIYKTLSFPGYDRGGIIRPDLDDFPDSPDSLKI